ncbi:MAG TPA: AraC family transcriptional regulator [Alphaproteobacteria bacterium]|nr:AraC family transcriptional regulator [Alphaproteobacteria bacterium]
MDQPLVVHAHSQCQLIFKCGGVDSAFRIAGQELPLHKRNAILINSWEPHQYLHRADSASAIHLSLYIEPAWLEAVDRKLHGMAHPALFSSPSAEMGKKTQKLADSLAHMLGWSGTVETAELECLTFELVAGMVREFADRGVLEHGAVGGTASDFRIRKAMRYMSEHSAEPLDVMAVARHSGLSRPHFFALFRQCTNLTPNLYANVLRMNEAVNHLSESADSIAEISEELGFNAQSHFTRFFRSHQGVPPTEFRRALR